MSSSSESPSTGFLDRLAAAVEGGTFVSLVLSGARGGSAHPARYDIRPVQLQSGLHLQWSILEGKQVRHENVMPDESLRKVRRSFGPEYRNAVLRTTTAEVQARYTKRGELQISERAAAPTAAGGAHDRRPERIIPEGQLCPFLAEIGVMTPAGQVRAQQQHKFRQINRYLEFVRDILPELPAEGTLEVVDCGCGKSGLTFALQHYLTQVCGREVHLVGLDWNADVLATCRGVATRLGLDGIEFQSGDIAGYLPAGPVHLVVSLHACDTATDAALAQAIRWGANVILAVPCCQHELAPQLTSAPLSALLQHGILRERLAADVTDALRAALLEAAGYRTQVLEFIDLEHTPKNLLLRAVRRTQTSATQSAAAREQYQRLKSLLGVSSLTLEALLRDVSGAAGDAGIVADEP
jgi:SAM-dependent methyltransferase